MKNQRYLELSASELMNKIKDSDEIAFQTLFDRLWERMYVLSYSILKDKIVSKDIVQEVWISIWDRREVINNENIEAYILKATRFRVYKELRDAKLIHFSKGFQESLTTSDGEGPLEQMYLKDTDSAIAKSIENLPKKCKEVFVLSRYSGLENSEISKKLGISKRTVETHISNAIRRVKSDLVFSFICIVSSFI